MASPQGSKKIKVVRSFYLNGAALKVGTVVDVPYAFGLEMIAAGKATDDMTQVPVAPSPAPAHETKQKEK